MSCMFAVARYSNNLSWQCTPNRPRNGKNSHSLYARLPFTYEGPPRPALTNTSSQIAGIAYEYGAILLDCLQCVAVSETLSPDPNIIPS